MSSSIGSSIASTPGNSSGFVTPLTYGSGSNTPPLSQGAIDHSFARSLAGRTTVSVHESSDKTSRVAATHGITPPIKMTSKLVMDQNTGEYWRVYIQVEGDKAGLLKQTEEAFNNIRDEFSDKRVFESLDQSGKNKVTFNHHDHLCVINGNPTTITLSPEFVQTYRAGIDSSNFDEDIVLERQMPVAADAPETPENTLAEAEEFAAKDSNDLGKIQEQIDKLEAIDTVSLSDAEKQRHADVLASLQAKATALEAKKTKYDLAADEYETPTSPISEATHISTLNQINQLNGGKLRMCLPANGRAWQMTNRAAPNYITAATPHNLLDIKPKLIDTFDVLPIIDGSEHSLLVIDKKGVAYHYDPSRVATAATNQALKALLSKAKEVQGNSVASCTNNVDSSLYCSNFFEMVCGLQVRNEDSMMFKGIKGRNIPAFTATERRAALALQNKEYLKKIEEQTAARVRNPTPPIEPAIRNCRQLNITAPTTTIPDSAAFASSVVRIPVTEIEHSAVDLTAIDPRSIVLGDLDGHAATDLRLRTPLLVEDSAALHRARALPILRDADINDYRFRSPRIAHGNTFETIDTVLSKAPTLGPDMWNEDATLKYEAKRALEEHIYRQAKTALDNKVGLHRLHIDPPKFYHELSTIGKLAVHAVYESVLNHDEFAGKIDQILFTGSTLEEELLNFEQRLLALDPDGYDLALTIPMIEEDARLLALRSKRPSTIAVIDRIAELKALLPVV